MYLISIFLIIFITLAVCLVLYKWVGLRSYNQKPLSIHTFDGLDSPYHPSVLFFKDGWNGWKYWMVETPFSPECKPYRDRNECPSVHVSMDGVTWQTPEKVNNPLVNLSEEQVADFDYFSDPHLLYNNGRLECIYRLTRRHGDYNDFSDVSLWIISSQDGINWDKPIELVRPKYPIVSPALTLSRTEGYRMWYVNSENHYSQRQIAFSQSFDLRTWSEPIICQLKGKTVNPWHIDVQNIGGDLYLTVYDYNELTLWRGNTDNPTEFEFIKLLLQPATKKYGSFYCNGLYRACLVKTDKGVELYFSADDSKRTYLGRMISESPEEQMVFAGLPGVFSSFLIFIPKLLHGYWRWGSFVIKNALKRIL